MSRETEEEEKKRLKGDILQGCKLDSEIWKQVLLAGSDFKGEDDGTAEFKRKFIQGMSDDHISECQDRLQEQLDEIEEEEEEGDGDPDEEESEEVSEDSEDEAYHAAKRLKKTSVGLGVVKAIKDIRKMMSHRTKDGGWKTDSNTGYYDDHKEVFDRLFSVLNDSDDE